VSVEAHIHGPVYHVAHRGLTVSQAIPVSIFRRLWPEWFLPRDFILKVFDVPARLERESDALEELFAIQGINVPCYYGTAQFIIAGTPKKAIALQYLHGSFPTKESISRQSLEEQVTIGYSIWECYHRISYYGVTQSDQKPDNLIIVDNNSSGCQPLSFEMTLILFFALAFGIFGRTAAVVRPP
jgi:hypothetical protein